MRKYMQFYRLYGELSLSIFRCGIIHTGLIEKREPLQITYMKKTNAGSQPGAHLV